MGGGSRYRPPSRYPPARYPVDNSIGGDMGSRYYPENRFPDNRPDRYPEADGRYYPTTVTGTRYPASDNRFPVGNDRSPIFILKYGNRYGGGGGVGGGGGGGSGNFLTFFIPSKFDFVLNDLLSISPNA